MIQKPELRCIDGKGAPGNSVGGQSAMQDENRLKNSALPAVLMKARRASLEELHQLLGTMFESADDTFFEYANQALTDQVRETYFETMRQLRLNRKEIERGFYQHINNGFIKLPEESTRDNKSLETVSSLESLSLLADDDLEMSVAMDGMVTKAKNKYAEGIYQLNVRLDALLPRVTINDKSNPFHPRHVCEAFKEASSPIECDIQNRLIIYKLFDKFVISKLDSFIDTANAVLADAGVLPDLKGTPKLGRTRGSSSAPREGEQSAKGEQQTAVKQAASELFGQLQALMASARGVPTITDVVSGPIGSAASDAHELSNVELFEILTRFQQVQPRGEDVVNGALDLPKFNARHMVANLLNQREKETGPERVGQTDSDVISLITMLFDFILDDENLPIPVKALVGRLQIPFLKLAVQDYSFFSRGGHPARKLLNELARAGIGLNEDLDLLKKDMVFKKVQSTVQRILNEYTNDAALFEELLDDFQRFMQTEVRRAQMIEQRTKSAEEGKAKTEMAEKIALETVRKRLDGNVVPEVAVRLLTDGWMSVLKLIFLKYGPESNNWLGAVKTIDHLLFSLTPPKDDAAKKRLFNVVPVLLKNLRQGLNTVSYNPFEMGEMLNELEQFQMQILRGETLESQKPAPSDPAKDLVEAVAEDMHRMGASPMVETAGKITRIDASRVGVKVSAEIFPELSETDPYMVQAKKINVGTWLEFRNETGAKTRAKLAARIKSADKLIFVNRTGVKIDEKTTLGLAHALKKGEVNILEDSQLFDRALENVIGNLRKVKQSNV